MTEDGPIIVEGNTDYCFEGSEMCSRKPLGETILPSLYLEALSNTNVINELIF